MRVISSQNFTDEQIVEEKKKQLIDEEKISLPVLHVEDDIFILTDGHHRLEAAKELGIEISFYEVEKHETFVGSDATPDEIYEAFWDNGDYRDVMTGDFVW